MKKFIAFILAFAVANVNAQTFPVQNLNILGNTTSSAFTQYGVMVGGGASNPVAGISPGTSGQVLTSNGPTANPSFQTLSLAGFVSIAATANAVSQSSGIGGTLLFTTTSAGMYVVYADIMCVQAGTAGTASLNIFWNNGSAAQQATTTVTLTTLGNESSAGYVILSGNAQNISYSVNVNGASGSPLYSVRIRLISLG